MPGGVMGHRGVRIALAVGGTVVLLLVLAQLLLPTLAAKHVSDRLARYGTVKHVSVHAVPALELLWGKADSVNVSAGTLTMTPAQVASLLPEARNVSHLTMSVDAMSLRIASLPNSLSISNLHMEKHDSVIQMRATLTQQQLTEALPSGFRVEPVASGGGQVEVKASGGLFGVQASIAALVKPLEGRLVAEPQGLPLASLATVTLFSNPSLKVESIGLQIERSQPLTYGLSLRASLS
ncbi:MAG: LmeA family phospholipid-binding protein [Solirubrobacteraceae bacterium]